MKSTQKIRRVQLRINQTDDSAMMGIVSAEPDYKLSLALNKKLRISLKSAHPVTIPDGTGPSITFSRFTDTEAPNSMIYDLVSNRQGKNFLLRKLKNIDYILKIYNPDNEADPDKIISSLRNTECITAVFNLGPESVKDKNLRYLIH